MTTPAPQQFLSDFCKDLVAHPGNRLELIAGYAKHLEARDRAIGVETLQGLLDWQDQARDLDDRPIGEPYFVIRDGAREMIALALGNFKKQGS